jgi:hypothetical protein
VMPCARTCCGRARGEPITLDVSCECPAPARTRQAKFAETSTVYIAREMMAIGLKDVRIVALGRHYGPDKFSDLCCESKPGEVVPRSRELGQ